MSAGDAVSHDAFFDENLGPTRVLAILRGYGPKRTLDLCHQAWDLGITLVEIPVQSPADLEALQGAVAEGGRHGRLVGAGTIVSIALLHQVAEAGAAFTVAPGLDEEIALASGAAGVPHLPGVATASEVHRAVQLGMTWLKAFPAAALGTGWIPAIHGPFPQVRLVATGGVDMANAAGFLAAGAAAVSLGSAFAAADPDSVRQLITPPARS